ncbi:unnamed protein product, partial [Callosobruchus maculatus]
MYFKSLNYSILFFSVIYITKVSCSLQGEEVSKWADALGKDLWTLGQAITQFSEIKQRYTFANAKVGVKDPQTLLAEIKKKISIMINRKIRAIQNIQVKAEQSAEEFEFNASVPFQYYSSRYSPIEGAEPMKLPKPLRKNKNMYLPMRLNNDTHFYNIAVNTNYSTVHVPVNIYDKEKAASFAIQWSESLTKVFKENYERDPALSWQYFGSTSGIMRHYPAKKWDDKDKKDKRLLLFDCRVRTWFIEAATCTKDVIILMDNSGSMDGMGHHIGSLTAFNILDTFSNNDYVNVLNYSSKTNYTIPCFQDMLVQATKENINVFKDAISALEPEGKTNLAQALEVAFDLLAKYRHKRGCEEDSSSCNQAIMVITDDVNGNLTDAVYKYNRFGSNIPVRIFTYLIGKEVSNVAEGKWLSCANRGFFTHVQSLEQVTEAVLQYITVIARPLVLQGEEHPVSWTHAYADLTYDDKNDNLINTPYRLLTSAAIPCYDTKTNKMNDTRTAYLLGVVGTDVPLDEFERLTVPYKIGVNGYVFIVSNNGYVLMHPDLRPVYQGILKDNYNSIDLTQVEQHDSNETVGPRQVVETLAKLRQDMVDGKESSLRKVKLKYHYDDMKRVYESAYDYYYTPLENTPFTIGIGIPHVYGNYTLEVENEILRNKHTGINLTSFFNGKWKIHPKWVYCKYHYLEGHEFPTPEKELLHFLGRMYDRDFQFQSQYEENVTVLQEDSYYCDEQLIQRLIFDAKITHESFGEKRNFSQREITLFEKYNASLRFVATMSGLTRWGYIFEEPRNDTRGSQAKEFGDFHPRAINEKWYKSAVLQHQYDESLVYSVPFDAGTKDESLVTGSFAIFPSEKGLEAPGSVVGFQFSQSKLHMEVKKISSKLSNQCSHCQRCNDTLDCYIIDASGYIIVSDDRNYTGRFFGEVEGDIMESMLDEGIFKQVTVFDYQALCKKDKPETSRGVTLLT